MRDGNILDKVVVKTGKSGWVLEMFRRWNWLMNWI